MKWLLAFNSFKNSLSAVDAVKAFARGLHKGGVKEDDIVLFPIADGGDDTARCLQFHLGGRLIRVPCHDPLQRPISASFLWMAHRRTAVVEMSAASGLRLLKPAERNPLHRYLRHGRTSPGRSSTPARRAVDRGGRERHHRWGCRFTSGPGGSFARSSGTRAHRLPLSAQPASPHR